MPAIISRAEARTLGLTHYFPGKLCLRGHRVKRRVSTGHCPKCAKMTRDIWVRANRNRCQERDKGYRLADPEKFRKRDRERQSQHNESTRKRQMANPEKYREAARKHRAANLNQYRMRDRERYVKNPEERRAQAKRYRKTTTGKLRQFCANSARCLQFTNLHCSRLSLLEYTGVEFIAHLENTLPRGMSFSKARVLGYEIDHIVPLSFITKRLVNDKKKILLAFQIAMDLRNLQMIPGIENKKKNSRIGINLNQKQVLLYLCEKYGVSS